ncbi:MAG: hypothetical protein HOQ44_10340, partial [Nocardia sp.]|nr:hypothetical protein [Nocardia sp.]
MSSESNTDRGDRRDSGRRQPIDGGLRQLLQNGRAQEGQQPARTEPVDNVASGWRGGSSWLNPSTGELRAQQEQDRPSPDPGSGATTPQHPARTPEVSRQPVEPGPPGRGPAAPGPGAPGTPPPNGPRPAPPRG